MQRAILYVYSVYKVTSFLHSQIISVKPLTVTIKGINGTKLSDSLRAGERYEVECETTGSRPPAVITWYKGKRSLKHVKVRVNNFILICIVIVEFTTVCELV